MNSFIAIYNQLGIACASDTDNTVFRLSKQEPVGVAVCPFSPIPWESYIIGYLRQGEPQHNKNLEEYARYFEAYLQQFPADLEWNHLCEDMLSLNFLGFGVDDIYPSKSYIHVKVNEKTGKLEFGEIDNVKISINNTAFLSWIGDFNCLDPILHGSTEKVKSLAKTKLSELFDTYKKRVIENFAGTKYEAYVNECLQKNSNFSIVDDSVSEATALAEEKLYDGIDTFSIEEMVTSSEKFVNANVRLNHLKKGGKGLIGSTREMAVLTRTEGFTWIKHSLFAI